MQLNRNQIILKLYFCYYIFKPIHNINFPPHKVCVYRINYVEALYFFGEGPLKDAHCFGSMTSKQLQ